MTDWQPIETAPKTRSVLVYMDGTASLGIYRAVFENWSDDGVNPRWRPEGYAMINEFPPGARITHWMPLPQAPGVDGGRADNPELTKPATLKDDPSSTPTAGVEAGGPLRALIARTAALRYAIAVLGTQADVASAEHRPIIEGYIRELDALLSAPVASPEEPFK